MNNEQFLSDREMAIKWWKEELTDMGRTQLLNTCHPGRKEHTLTGRELTEMYHNHKGSVIEDDIKN